MSARYTLHGIWASGPTYTVGLMLALAGEAFNYEHLDLRSGAHRTPEFQAKSRFGQVPCLEDLSNGRHLSQSASILEYLADKTGKFGGATLEERIAAREWMFWGWDKLARGVYRPRAAKLGFAEFPPDVLDHYVKDGEAGLASLDSRLAGRTWLVGEGPTIADIALYGIVAYAPQGGHALAPLANLTAWMGRIEALPGFMGPGELLPKESRAA
jgi:glutathione S-transferase